MNNQDTTAVLSPISGQAEETEQQSQPAPKPSADGMRRRRREGAKPAPERKRSPKLSEDKRFKIFCGSSNRALSEEICKFVGVPLGESKLQRFADGEVYFQLLENVRGVDVFVVQPTCYPVDEHLMELLIMIDALKRASARQNHGGDSVLRLCPAGPQGPAARRDYGKAGGGSVEHGRCEPGVAGGSARGADSGLFQYPGGPPVCQPGAGGLLPGVGSARSDGGFAGCGWRGTRALLRQEAGSSVGHRGQAADGHERDRGDERDRRCARAARA